MYTSFERDPAQSYYDWDLLMHQGSRRSRKYQRSQHHLCELIQGIFDSLEESNAQVADDARRYYEGCLSCYFPWFEGSHLHCVMYREDCPEIYEALRHVVHSDIDSITRRIKLKRSMSEAKFLTFVVREHRRLRRRGSQVEMAFHESTPYGAGLAQYRFVRRVRGTKVLNIFDRYWNTVPIDARLGNLARRSSIKLILNTGLPPPIMYESVVRDILIGPLIAKHSRKPRIASEKRCIYLLATRIERSASISDGENGQSPEIFHALRWRSVMAKFHHWALLITKDDGEKRGSILCQLTVSNGRVGFDATEDPQLVHGALESGQCIGFTMCSNNEIRDQARQVLHSMPVAYNVFSNNCQIFCSRLFERIRQVTNPSELYAGRRNLHWEELQQIAKRRAIELVYHVLAYELGSRKATSRGVDVTPSSLDGAVVVLINMLTVVILYWSYWQVTGGTYLLLVLALGLHNLYGNCGLFRVLQRNQQLNVEACEEEDTTKLAELVIDHFKSIGYIEGRRNAVWRTDSDGT